MKKNGFTLIELLAVIAILAILVIIAVPTVLKLFNNAKLNTFKVESESILKAAKDGYASSVMTIGNVEETIYTYDEDGDLTTEGNIDIKLTGRKLKNSIIKISPTGVIEFAIKNGNYCATILEGESEITYDETEECTLISVPSAPLILSAGPAGAYASLTWNAPENIGGSPIIGYKIERRRASESYSVLVENTGNANTSYTDNTQPICLGTYQMYYRIAAINAIGVSEYSNEIYHTHTDGC